MDWKLSTGLTYLQRVPDLGSSSSFLVGLLLALHTLEGRHVSKETLADQACYIEIEKCEKPIGIQDQYRRGFWWI